MAEMISPKPGDILITNRSFFNTPDKRATIYDLVTYIHASTVNRFGETVPLHVVIHTDNIGVRAAWGEESPSSGYNSGTFTFTHPDFEIRDQETIYINPEMEARSAAGTRVIGHDVMRVAQLSDLPEVFLLRANYLIECRRTGNIPR